ncbi:phage major capsid protein [Synechococcus sp. CCY 9618]|uniref:phage major capsid protein n=1 Tax=Synechococcus sp. CCY 9618 TaxID=2815602 RepID=UPI00352DFD6B
MLSHDPGAVDLSRLNGGTAPLLWNHSPDAVIGVVEQANIRGKRGRARVRWGTSDLAQQIRRDVEAGIISAVSTGYQILDSVARGAGILATSWQPLEVSLVSIPADATVGIGRSLTPSTRHTTMASTKTTTADISPADDNGQADAIAALSDQVAKLTRQLATPAQPVQRRAVPIAGASDYAYASLGLSDREQRSYSIVKAIQAQATGRWDEAGLELEASRAMAQQLGKNPRGFYVPTGDLQLRSTYVVGTDSLGGNLVQDEVRAESFIEALRNRAVVAELGAQMLPGLVGNVLIPRRSGVSSTYWVAESGALTESNGTFDQVSLTPKTLGCLSKFSRLSQLQSTPEIEQLIRQDFAAQVALGIDAAALYGAGSSNEPLGIAGTSGIGAVVGGTNGALLTFDHLMDLIKEVSIDNADAAGAAFILNARSEARLMQIKDSQGNYLMGPGSISGGAPGALWGRRFAVTNQARSNLTKGTASGVASEVFYGDFSQLVIGMWGGLDIAVDPYTNFNTGDVQIRAFSTVDIGVRQPSAFARMADALTA